MFIQAILILHLLICLALIGAILLQRSEGGGLGIGGAAVHVRANAQVAALLLGLPSAGEMIGRELTVKKIDPTANTVTVRAYQAESIDGAPERVLATAWSWLTVRASAANSWDIIAQGGTVS
jgi:hypothetical protein